jgi:dethiobiotin synthetase
VSIFIIATGTDVGKTITSSAIMVKYGEVKNLFYWKPIQTGNESNSDTKFLEDNLGDSRRLMDPAYAFSHPSSPHFSASLEGREICREYLNSVWERNESLVLQSSGSLLIEGVGGLLVPLNEEFLLLDWIEETKLPVLLVVSTEMGTINHSLLSIETLKNRKIPIIGFIGYGQEVQTWESSRLSIVHWSGVPSLGRFYLEKNLTHLDFIQSILDNFDPEQLILRGLV